MLMKLFRNVKYFYFPKNIFRMYCNVSSSNEIVKIGKKCYTPVRCPEETISGITEKYTRLVRAESSKVRLGFIPDEWFNFFGQKTGATGPYVFLVSFTTFLISKEIYIMEHEYYCLLSVIILIWITVTKVGPNLGKSLDKAIDEYENEWTTQRTTKKTNLEEFIEHENKMQKSMEGQLVLQDAKRENVALQLEAEYRKRLFTVFKDVKMRLDFQVVKPIIFKRLTHKNLIEWILQQVVASYTDDRDKKMVDICIDHLTTLSKNMQ